METFTSIKNVDVFNIVILHFEISFNLMQFEILG